MHKPIRYLSALLVLLWTGILSAILITVRYILRTPQPLQSVLPGKAYLYKWTYGHVYYHICGEHNAPPLLLLHTPELAASSSMLRTLAEGLAQHYCVYALDLLGFGQSDHPAIAYSADMYVRLYHDFLMQVLARPTTVLACGLSCNYSVVVANREPALCERLILLSPVSLFGQQHRRWPQARLLHVPLVGLVVYAALTRRPLLRAALARQHGYAPSTGALNYASAVAHQLGAHHAPLAWLAGDLELDVTAQLEQVAQPVLIFWGIHALHNKLKPASQYGLSARTQVILVDDAGIGLQEERPGKVIANILTWRSETAPRAVEALIGTGGTGDTAETAGHAMAAKVSEQRAGGTSLASPQPARPAGEVEVSEVPVMPIPTPPGEETMQVATPTPPIENQEAAPELQAEETGVPVEAPAAPAAPVTELERQAAVERAIEAYCVKCKQKRPMLNPTAIVTKNGRRALEAICPVCSTKLFRFVAG